MKKHEQYWEKHAKNNGLSEMNEWFGDFREENRNYPRKLLKRMGYTSVLDAGAGFCAEYYGFQRDYPGIKYTALEITPSFVKIGKENGINIIEGSVENLPFPDNSFDVVYVRDTLRHVEFYEKAIQEALRVCRKEVTIVFCRQLSNKEEHVKEYKEDLNL